mmetsp:Transcript_34761/g.81143  ORF Transcript_34761/g.81143 Transcript_34761/m.81143 type:complete len:520 (+) Transcript_34761:93-1652(+)
MGSEKMPEPDDDDKEVLEADEDEDQERERGAQYLDFRRKFDAMKAEVKGQQSKAESLKQQGNNLFSFGCFSQAAIMYSEAIELQPKNAVLYCNRSMAYLKQDMPDEALTDAETSLDLDDSAENVKAYWRKAQALLDLGRIEEAEAAADAGIGLQPGNHHLNKVRKKAREAQILKRISNCEWVGMQNGVERKMSFNEDGSMAMSLFGHSVGATYDLSVEGKPWSMVVRMKGEEMGFGNGPPPPPVPYIFEFQSDDELWLCHSIAGPSEGLPTKFEGPGFIKMSRKELPAKEALKISHEPLDVRCIRYMTKMNEIMPLVPPQLPEKPSGEQVEDEIRVTAAISALKKEEGSEVHRRAIAIAKDPQGALSGNPTLSEEQRATLRSLAEQFRKRLIARKLAPEEAAVVEPPTGPSELRGDDLLHPGAEVEIYGLTGAVELNGARGRLLHFDAETGRWAVELADSSREGAASTESKGKRVRSENLRLISPSSSKVRASAGSFCPPTGSPLSCLAGIARHICSRT